MTYAQLVSPQMLARPMKWNDWLLRAMILHPERFCDPSEKAAWLAKHGATQDEINRQFKAGEPRMNYGKWKPSDDSRRRGEK